LLSFVLALLPVGCRGLRLFSLRWCRLLRRRLPTFDYSGRRRCRLRLCRWLLLLPLGVLLLFLLLLPLSVLLLFLLLLLSVLLLFLLLLPLSVLLLLLLLLLSVLLLFLLLLPLGVLLLFLLLLLGVLLLLLLLLPLSVLLLFLLLLLVVLLLLSWRHVRPFSYCGLRSNRLLPALWPSTHHRLNAFHSAHIHDTNGRTRRRSTLTYLLDLGCWKRATGILS
jgi:hypothetical protein